MIGMKQNAAKLDLTSILPEETASRVKLEAEMSMGSEITSIDLVHIQQLCFEIVEMADYRQQLHDYLRNRMAVLAPNLTVLLGELVGARMIAKAGKKIFFMSFS
jgi:nucleolar protein 58